MSQQIDNTRKTSHHLAAARDLSDSIHAADCERAHRQSPVEQALCHSQFRLPDVDGEAALCERDHVKCVDPENTDHMLHAQAFAVGTRERRQLIDVLTKMAQVVLESQRDPDTEPVEALFAPRDDEATSVLGSPPAENTHSD